MTEENKLLKEYQSKRHFGLTPEPSGQGGRRSGAGPIFVIQKHQASTLHYDFRLEADGVLKSWAVPKGPSTDPRVKRLAMPTEDHPLEYAGFEGTIPAGEYGAGAVEIWDTGTYRNMTVKNGQEVPSGQAVADGHIAFWLEGRKLSGGYALTRTGQGKNERWLLVKMADEKADPGRDPVIEQPDSAVSGRSLDQIREEK